MLSFSLYLSHSLQELQNLPLFPSEIIPLFLYLGDHRHAYNASLNYDLKLHNHLRLGNDQELPPAFPESVNELHIDIEDTPDADMTSHFEEILEFIGENISHSYSNHVQYGYSCTHSLSHSPSPPLPLPPPLSLSQMFIEGSQSVYWCTVSWASVEQLLQ